MRAAVIRSGSAVLGTVGLLVVLLFRLWLVWSESAVAGFGVPSVMLGVRCLVGRSCLCATFLLPSLELFTGESDTVPGLVGLIFFSRTGGFSIVMLLVLGMLGAVGGL